MPPQAAPGLAHLARVRAALGRGLLARIDALARIGDLPPVERIRARTVVGVFLGTLLSCFAFATVLLIGGQPIQAVANLALLLPLAAPLALIRAGHHRWAGNVGVALIFAAIATPLGPEQTLSRVAIVVLPAVAVATTGPRWGTLWTGVALLWAIGTAPYVDVPPIVVNSAVVITLLMGLIAVFSDITHRESHRMAARASQRLADNEARVRRFAEAVFPAFGEIAGGALRDPNGSITRLLAGRDYARAPVPLLECVHPDDRIHLIERLDGTPVDGFLTEVRLRLPGDAYAWLEMLVLPASGDPLAGWLIAARRIDAEVALRTRMIDADRTDGILLAAASVSHDFGNLLMVILSNATLLPESDGRDAILSATESAIPLSRQLIELARRPSHEVQRIDVAASVARLGRMVRAIKVGIEVVHQHDGPAVSTRIDPLQFHHALLNLVVNARDAMPDGGTIALRTARVQLDAAAAAQLELPPGGYARIDIRDTGTGMDAATLARAFDPFFTTKSNDHGTGLGLPGARATAIRAGGTLSLASTPGQGTCATFLLPESG